MPSEGPGGTPPSLDFGKKKNLRKYKILGLFEFLYIDVEFFATEHYFHGGRALAVEVNRN